jgi:hypothetical protein
VHYLGHAARQARHLSCEAIFGSDSKRNKLPKRVNDFLPSFFYYLLCFPGIFLKYPARQLRKQIGIVLTITTTVLVILYLNLSFFSPSVSITFKNKPYSFLPYYTSSGVTRVGRYNIVVVFITSLIRGQYFTYFLYLVSPETVVKRALKI